jgi:hypothetical protein
MTDTEAQKYHEEQVEEAKKKEEKKLERAEACLKVSSLDCSAFNWANAEAFALTGSIPFLISSFKALAASLAFLVGVFG